MKTCADRLRTQRCALGLKKRQLADQAGIHHSIISRLESGEYQYSRHLFPLADVLQVNVDWLVRGREPIYPPFGRKKGTNNEL